MPNSTPNTPLQGWPIPTNADDPDIPGDMATLALAIERRVVGVYATQAALNSTTAGKTEEGMFAYTSDTNSFWSYNGTAWVGFPTVVPIIRSGTAAPSNGTGIDGDVYIQY